MAKLSAEEAPVWAEEEEEEEEEDDEDEDDEEGGEDMVARLKRGM